MTSRTRAKHARQIARAKRRQEARALRARLVLKGDVPPSVLESAKTNDLGILRKLIFLHKA